MIEKMAYVNVIGPKKDFDRITDEYLAKYEIHLENAVLQLDGHDQITPFSDTNPYKDLQTKAGELMELFGTEGQQKNVSAKKAEKAAKKAEKALLKKYAGQELSGEEACSLVVETYEALYDHSSKKKEYTLELEECREDLENLRHFKGLNYKLEDILKFNYVAYRFGRIPKEAWKFFKENSDENIAGMFKECTTDNEYVWGVYFALDHETAKVDGEFASLRFERVKICDKYEGTPDEICDKLENRIKELEAGTESEKNAIDKMIADKKDALWLANDKLGELSHNFDARKYAACIQSNSRGREDTPYFVLCGWMRTKEAEQLKTSLDSVKDTVCVIDNTPEDNGLVPPTSIKNKGIFKPYEMYVKMYGLPAYNEFDPTMLVAILYSVIFGAMFGDLGHGLVLLVGGLLLYFVKRSQLAGIIAFAGFFSCIFGLLFGSFFGFEEAIPTLWLKPREAMSTLNFVGRLNTVFALAVAFGMILMLVLMIINVLSHIKQKAFMESVFTSNGIAGFLFYGSIVLIVFLYMFNKPLPATGILLLMIIVPLVMIAINEPVMNALKKRKVFESGIGMYFVETFFDLFETLLSYFSSTLSFVRIGAFAVSHAAMMEVVLSLTGYAHGGQGTLIGLIAGNIFVIGFEGLIVGIQVLRLQYYEIFSKFYKGDGREFKPFFVNRRNIKC